MWIRHWALSALVLLATAAKAESDVSSLRAGLGVALLETPLGAPLAGYGGVRDRLAESVFDAPEARTLVLERDGLRVALLVLDIVIVRPKLTGSLKAAAQALEIDQLVTIASHTHSGPGGNMPGFAAQRMTAGSFDPNAPRRLERAAALALRRGVADLAPARVASRTVELELARNRRREDGPAERALPVLRLDFEDGRAPIAAFAYGAHPTVLGPMTAGYSADYPGAARRRLAFLGWRPLFLPGPLGDQEPSTALGELWTGGATRQLAQVHAIGTKLGQAVDDALDELGPGTSEELRAVRRNVALPELRLRRFCALWWLGPALRGSIADFLSSSVAFTAVQLGEARLVALPVEPVSRIGAEIRSQTRGAVVIAHAGDWVGYTVDTDAYARGGYEACLSFHGPGMGEFVVRETVETWQLLESDP